VRLGCDGGGDALRECRGAWKSPKMRRIKAGNRMPMGSGSSPRTKALVTSTSICRLMAYALSKPHAGLAFLRILRFPRIPAPLYPRLQSVSLICSPLNALRQLSSSRPGRTQVKPTATNSKGRPTRPGASSGPFSSDKCRDAARGGGDRDRQRRGQREHGCDSTQ
jgi:hypothetical protein